MSRLPLLLFIFFYLSAYQLFATDQTEQAYVRTKIAWCVNEEHRENGLWQRCRSDDCEYKVRHEWDLIRDVCKISVMEGWREADNWTMIISDPNRNAETDHPSGNYFFYIQKMHLGEETRYSISWNGNDAGEPEYSHAQWNLGEDYTYSKHPTKDIHTIKGHESEIIINFECSLVKYPEPEALDIGAYFEDCQNNWDMKFKMTELIKLHDARIRQLMEEKIQSIEEDYSDPEVTHHRDNIIQHAVKAQEAWKAYATARANEVFSTYCGGSGAGVRYGWEYVELQRKRISELKTQYK